MCRAISPASFLALAFKKKQKASLPYDELECLRCKLTALISSDGEKYDVDWSHDSYLFTMGFYAPIFKDDGKSMTCNMSQLENYFNAIVSDLMDEEVEKLEEIMS